jgi:zinc protease
VARAKVQAEAHFVFRLQSVGGFGGKSDQLNAYNTFLDDPSFFERDLERYRAVTRESLQAHVRRFLKHDRRVALSIVPHGREDLALPGSRRAEVS